MKHTEIRKKCLTCEHQCLKQCGELALEIYWCTMGNVACEDIKHCDVKGKAWILKEMSEVTRE